MKKILIVEGNPADENKSFSFAGIQTHTESLKDSLNFFTNELKTHVINPSSDENIDKNIDTLESYDGLIWGGSSLNIYNNTPEIRKQIDFMRVCQKKIKKMLAICWGMQVAVTAAGGEVKKGNKGSHRGIALNIEINENGLNHPLYKNKDKKFNTPAFNFDEVITMPENSTLLASNSINHVQGINFKVGICNIWGLQYHPEITYNKMINLIIFRKKRLLEKGAFKDENEIDNHIKYIETENNKLDKVSRMRELENWLNYLNLE
jgi:GMP synthase (glutamine-hydrolysing)